MLDDLVVTRTKYTLSSGWYTYLRRGGDWVNVCQRRQGDASTQPKNQALGVKQIGIAVATRSEEPASGRLGAPELVRAWSQRRFKHAPDSVRLHVGVLSLACCFQQLGEGNQKTLGRGVEGVQCGRNFHETTGL